MTKTTSLQRELKVTPEEAAKLDFIPGLRVENGKAYSRIDGMAVAHTRIGIPPPPKEICPKVTIPEVSRLRDYQQDGVTQLYGTMLKSGGALLADDLGLGKTLQAITLMKMFKGRIFVVCPAYVRETWREELAKWGETSVAILGPMKTKADTKEWESAHEKRVIVTSYEMAGKAREMCLGGRAPELLVMDEAHLLKGRKTKRSQNVVDVGVLTPYKLAMTATPMWSRPRDFYRILNVLFGRRFGSGFEFDLAYSGGHINEYGGLENRGATRTDELKLRLSYYMVRREKKDVLKELPPLTRQVIWVDPTSTATLAMQRAILTKDGGGMVSALQATLADKMEAAMELAEQAKRFLMFTYRKDHARYMAQTLAEDRDTPCVCVTGDLGTQERMAQVNLAKSKGWGVVATIDSLGAGMNLQGVASTGIMHSIDWVPAKMVQAEGRIHRMGQTENVHWIYIAMKESMDSIVVSNVVNKMDQWHAIMGRDGTTQLRNALGDHVDGAGAKDAEDAALKAIYDSMGG